ncbi:MAG: TPM domain-containing protein [Candidatus Omnitrophica bacterium]|nr:TPM domain-containing protein [Candidatus Omnitrophota bacterium]
MRKRPLFIFLALYVLNSACCLAADIPRPEGWVNDFANVLSSDEKDKIGSLALDLEEKSSVELAVVTAGSIAPYDEKEYARLLFDSWKPGKKGKDNGVLILLAVKERLWRIETGYGIEGTLPDGLCGDIGRQYMVPYFKEGKYGEGLYQGGLKVYNIVLKQDYSTAPPEAKNEFSAFEILIIMLLLNLPWFLIRFFYRRNKTYLGGGDGGGYWGGGGFGGGGGGGGFGGFGGGSGGGGGAGGRF